MVPQQVEELSDALPQGSEAEGLAQDPPLVVAAGRRQGFRLRPAGAGPVGAGCRGLRGRDGTR